MSAGRWTRRTGYAAVFAVSGVAALLSYWHAVAVVGSHGEPGVYGHLYPATIDGLIVAASMVLLDCARRKIRAPSLAWVLLWCGIAATLCANVLNGVSHGFLGSVIAAWPAAAFVGAYEMIMVLIRLHAGDKAAAAGIPAPEPYRQFRTPGEAPEPPGHDDTQAVPALQDDFPVADPFTAGHVTVSSPLSRLDRKVQSDARHTGQFPAVTS